MTPTYTHGHNLFVYCNIAIYQVDHYSNDVTFQELTTASKISVRVASAAIGVIELALPNDRKTAVHTL